MPDGLELLLSPSIDCVDRFASENSRSDSRVKYESALDQFPSIDLNANNNSNDLRKEIVTGLFNSNISPEEIIEIFTFDCCGDTLSCAKVKTFGRSLSNL